jgi:hypothetical protein
MNLNIQETIDSLESVNKRLGFGHGAICDAIKVCEMWRKFGSDNRNSHIYFATKPNKSIDELMSKTREEYFPSTMTQTVTIEVEGKDEEFLRDTIQQIRLLYGVKAVRPHDSKY